jgi:glycosyltransferase involved in cell wall biosynthesis
LEITLVPKRLLIIQYMGDYREAFRRFAIGGDETYYAQKYSVDAVSEMRTRVDEVATLCCITSEPYDEMLGNGVRAIGTGFSTRIELKELIKLIEKYDPTHLILRTPMGEIIRWAIRRNVKIMATLADSFDSKTLRNKIRNYQLARLLNNKQVDWVGNHGANASASLKKIGVTANKIIPWDFPHSITPELFSAKLLPERKAIWEVVYVGSIVESKGVGDILRAISVLKSKRVSILLKIIGKGDVETYINLARNLQVEDCVEFLGLLPNKDIIPAMRRADIVLVPSRHQYPEGFPFIIYEALCSRTPIIASDHPMFLGKLINETNALIFPAENSAALASCIEKLTYSPTLYKHLSLASYDAWSSLQIPVKWDDFINCWLSDSPEDRQWLTDNSLSSGRYEQSN